MEIWKKIKGYENYYEISNLGRVKSLEKTVINNGGFTTRKERILPPKLSTTKYLKVDLCVNRKTKHFYVHRLVALMFIDNPNNKPYVNHIDANKQNNNLSNLEWVTPQENIKHSVINNLHARGDRHGRKKLTEKIVTDIRSCENKDLQILADKYNVTKATISRILNNKIWKNV